MIGSLLLTHLFSLLAISLLTTSDKEFFVRGSGLSKITPDIESYFGISSLCADRFPLNLSVESFPLCAKVSRKSKRNRSSLIFASSNMQNLRSVEAAEIQPESVETHINICDADDLDKDHVEASHSGLNFLQYGSCELTSPDHPVSEAIECERPPLSSIKCSRLGRRSLFRKKELPSPTVGFGSALLPPSPAQPPLISVFGRAFSRTLSDRPPLPTLAAKMAVPIHLPIVCGSPSAPTAKIDTLLLPPPPPPALANSVPPPGAPPSLGIVGLPSLPAFYSPRSLSTSMSFEAWASPTTMRQTSLKPPFIQFTPMLYSQSANDLASHTMPISPVSFDLLSVSPPAVPLSSVSFDAYPRLQKNTKEPHLRKKYCTGQSAKICEPCTQLDTVAWDELFELQHEDGYWECTGRLSSFLRLDIDYFANVFLKEKGICSLGVKAHVDILKLVATLLVLQLIRVKKLAEGELLLSLFKLKESQEPTPVHREAVKRAVDWACWADRQYPCVCSRLELGWDWESSTRQLLGFDSPLPFSPLIPVLERHSVIQSCRTWALGEQVYS